MRTLNVVLVLPLVLRNFTDAETALWSVFSTLLMFQLLADFGFQTTFTRFTAYAFAGATDLARVGRDPGTSPDGGPNWELVRRITGTTRWLFRALGWVLFGLCMTLGTAFLWRRVEELGLAPGRLADQAAALAAAGDPAGSARLAARVAGVTTPTEAWIAWAVIVTATVVRFRGNGALSYLLGTGKVALARRWEALSGLGSIATGAIVLGWKGDLLSLVVANQAWVVLAVARNGWLARQAHGGRLRQYPGPLRDDAVLRVAWPPAWRAGVAYCASQGAVQLGALIYAQQRDSAAVASYLI